MVDRSEQSWGDKQWLEGFRSLCGRWVVAPPPVFWVVWMSRRADPETPEVLRPHSCVAEEGSRRAQDGQWLEGFRSLRDWWVVAQRKSMNPVRDRYVGIKYVLLVDGINLDVWLASVRRASDDGLSSSPSWKGKVWRVPKKHLTLPCWRAISNFVHYYFLTSTMDVPHVPRARYSGLSRKLVVALDIGTTFSGAAYALLDPGEVPQIRSVTRQAFPPVPDHLVINNGERKIGT